MEVIRMIVEHRVETLLGARRSGGAKGKSDESQSYRGRWRSIPKQTFVTIHYSVLSLREGGLVYSMYISVMGAIEICGGHFKNIHWLTAWLNEWADELYGAKLITVNSSHGRNMHFSQTIWLTLRKDVDFILFTPHFISFIAIYFLKRRSGQYQNKAEDSAFNYLSQGRTSHANAAWVQSSEQKHFFFWVCFPWKCWTEYMKLILIRVGF